MQLISVPVAAMALVSAYVGAYHLVAYLKRRQEREYLPFAAVCFSVALYDVFACGLYNATSLDDGLRWQRLQLDVVLAIATSIVWFAASLSRSRSPRLIRISTAWFACVFAASMLLGPDFTLSADQPAIKHIALAGQTFTYFEGSVGPVYQVEIASVIVVFVYLFFLLARQVVRARHRPILFLLASQILYFAGVVNDSLVAAQVYSFVYVSEYAFFAVIMAMAYVLLDRLVAVYTAYEHLNADLERTVDERTHQMRMLNDELRRLADHDGLTGAYSRRFLDDYLKVELKRARGYVEHRSQVVQLFDAGMNFGLALLDIDHFKEINDRYGHPAGDAVLAEVVRVVEQNTFERDLVCRYGGDEFAVVLTKTSSAGLRDAVEKIRDQVDGHVFDGDPGLSSLHVTISIGLIDFSELTTESDDDVLRLVDERLLMAKEMGRNQVVFWSAA